MARFAIPKQVFGITPEFVRNWVPTAAAWGAAAGSAVIFLTEWKVVLQYAPIIGDRYKPKEDK